jgi:hypothetical protein
VPDGSIGDDGTWTEEPETAALKAWGLASHFVIGQNGHSGAMVVNYPWDYTYTLAPDNAAFIRHSEEFSWYNQPMWNGDFYHGITNGAQWYIIKGGLQDWAYHETGSMDVTVEFSNSYQPPAAQLDTYWDNNRESFMHWIRAARYGVCGRITAADTNEPLAATVTVTGINKTVASDPDFGDYYKLLDTGTYTLSFAAPGYERVTVQGVHTIWGTPTVLDVALPMEGTPAEPIPPVATALAGAHPNPFNPSTTRRFTLAQEGRARVEILDLAGRRVRRLLDSDLPAGAHSAVWDGRDDAGRAMAGGVYLARFQSGSVTGIARLVLLK